LSVTVTSARPTKGERTREAILTRAVQHACVVGIGGVTLGDLSSDLGLSKSGLYAHFGSKEALQLAVLDHAGTQFAESVIVPALSVPRGEQRVRALAGNWIDCCRDREPNGCLFVKSSIEIDDQPGPVRDFLREQHLRFYDSLARVVLGGVSTGQFNADLDAEQFARDWYGVMLAYYHAHRLLSDPRAEARARAGLEALIQAARAHSSAAPSPAPSDAATSPAAPNPPAPEGLPA
jgi:AcrR family transcriptional regulator